MAEQVAGFPYWEARFDEKGNLEDRTQTDAMLAELPGEELTDLFVFSHGWNNSAHKAREIYGRFFEAVREVLDAQGADGAAAARIGVIGVIWPSMRWPDEPDPVAPAGGAAGLGAASSDAATISDLKAVFAEPAQQRAIDELARLLEDQPEDEGELRRFQELMRELAPSPDTQEAPEDNGEVAPDADEIPLVDRPAEDVFDHFATVAEDTGGGTGGAAGIGNPFKRLWAGAKEALRSLTYWRMKDRAGVVGRRGLGPLIGRIHDRDPDLRVHLVGHSFGARLVSFSLAGLPADATEAASPVKSVVLLQGAFSHFSFASALPHDPGRPGALAGMTRRVDGPIVASHSRLDTAVGKLYPWASLLSGQDASATEAQMFRWGAIGYDGAQGIDAADESFGPVGHRYRFSTGKFANLDGNRLITEGDPPSGAHSDIFHPEIAWAALSAAGVVRQP